METAKRQDADHDVRPWGEWANLDEDRGYKVKKLVVKPGHRMSLQYHNHRSEHWVVVQGKARVVLGSQQLTLELMQSVHVPVGTNHRIENPFDDTLVIIEVQHGDKLVEEDIVRLEDDYDRTNDEQEKST